MAADENIITWNSTNWTTIVLMAVIGFAIVGFVQSYYKANIASA